MKKYAFIDRDGTLIVEPDDQQVDRIDKVALVPGVMAALTGFIAAGYRLVMVSNQDGLGQPCFPEQEFTPAHEHMLALFSSQGIHFDEVLICPHLPPQACTCRKPQVGLVRPYLAQAFDRQRSIVVGDRESDMELARNMGIAGHLLAGDNGWADILRQVVDRPRRSSKSRRTNETEISIDLDIDGDGKAQIRTGLGFFDHMLEQIARHAGIDISIAASGDLHVDDHHLVEDVGILLGSALADALGDKRGIGRYGFVLPMDEASAQVSLDLSGRAHFVFRGVFTRDKLGELSTELIPHFWRSFSDSLAATLHIEVKGENCHHQAEAIFKGVARCLRQAVARTGASDLPSTKGVL